MFEKPSQKTKDDIKKIRGELRVIENQISHNGGQNFNEAPVLAVKKSDPYTFGSSKPKTGESVMHTRTIPQPINMWVMQTEQVE